MTTIFALILTAMMTVASTGAAVVDSLPTVHRATVSETHNLQLPDGPYKHHTTRTHRF
jgi:hypothetical protein